LAGTLRPDRLTVATATPLLSHEPEEHHVPDRTSADLDDPSADGPEAPLSSQQCGRCRRVFEMESTTEPGTIPEMWLCASCRVALLGRPTIVDHHT
jgi:hypothetical protein